MIHPVVLSSPFTLPMDRERKGISKENGRGNLASAKSENIRNSPSIPSILGVYLNLILDVNELSEIVRKANEERDINKNG